MVRRFCGLSGRSSGPTLDTSAATGALEESRVSDSDFAAPSPPKAVS